MCKIIKVIFLLVISISVSCALRCNKGVTSLMNDRVLESDVISVECGSGEVCVGVNAKINLRGMESHVYVGSCAIDCEEEERRGCGYILEDVTSEEKEGDPRYNITSCDVKCCDSEDLCNKSPDQAQFQCYSGMLQTHPTLGVVSDDTEPGLCRFNEKYGSEAACLKATLVMDGGTNETTGTLVLTQCQPAQVCQSFTCDLVKQSLPDNVRRMVTSCATSCCTDNLCNKATTVVAQGHQLAVVILLTLLINLII